uniref:Putative secreted protein n=1 Tax=Ixodes ricinus TaxID=34613 RepID=A0A6B0UPV9_IXORI
MLSLQIGEISIQVFILLVLRNDALELPRAIVDASEREDYEGAVVQGNILHSVVHRRRSADGPAVVVADHGDQELVPGNSDSLGGIGTFHYCRRVVNDAGQQQYQSRLPYPWGSHLDALRHTHRTC